MLCCIFIYPTFIFLVFNIAAKIVLPGGLRHHCIFHICKIFLLLITRRLIYYAYPARCICCVIPGYPQAVLFTVMLAYVYLICRIFSDRRIRIGSFLHPILRLCYVTLIYLRNILLPFFQRLLPVHLYEVYLLLYLLLRHILVAVITAIYSLVFVKYTLHHVLYPRRIHPHPVKAYSIRPVHICNLYVIIHKTYLRKL